MNDGCKGSEIISLRQEKPNKNLQLGLQNVTISHFITKYLVV